MGQMTEPTGTLREALAGLRELPVIRTYKYRPYPNQRQRNTLVSNGNYNPAARAGR